MKEYNEKHAKIQVETLFELLAKHYNVIIEYENMVTHEKKSTQD